MLDTLGNTALEMGALGIGVYTDGSIPSGRGGGGGTALGTALVKLGK